MEWIYKGSPVPADFDISGYYGFVYIITNLKNNRMYIGAKCLWRYREFDTDVLTKKGKRMKMRFKKGQSNWRNYYGSCKELKNDIKEMGKGSFKREILYFYETKSLMYYHESRLLFNHEVLTETFEDGTYKYYNANIMGKYYRNIFIGLG